MESEIHRFSAPESPSVSIVTVAYNEGEAIRRTIESVIGQTYQKIEYIVVDGGSTDNTLDIIEEYGDHIDSLVSEPDKGPYDGMNKGAALARGDYINFMNAGDWLHADSSVADVIDRTSPGTDIVCSDYVNHFKDGAVLDTARPTTDVWKGMITCHQAILARTAQMKKHPFDLRYKYAADFDFVYGRYLDGATFARTGVTMANYNRSGISSTNPFAVMTEGWRISTARNPSLKAHLYFAQRAPIKIAQSLIQTVSPSLHDSLARAVIRRRG